MIAPAAVGDGRPSRTSGTAGESRPQGPRRANTWRHEIPGGVNTPYRPPGSPAYVHAMKTNHKKALTFGDLIAAVYGVCGKRRAQGIVRLAVNAQVVAFRAHKRFVIS
jgi:hypothetical protein